MEKLFVNIVNFIGDKSISFFKKSFYLIIIIILVLLVNDYFGFSFNYRINQKLNQLKSIQELNTDFEINHQQQFDYLSALECEIINRQTLYERSYTFLKELFNNKLSVKAKNILKRIFTGSIVYLIFIVISAFTDKKDFPEIFLGFLILILFTNLLLLIIPTFEKFYINHIINIVTSLIILFLVGIFADDDDENDDKCNKNKKN